MARKLRLEFPGACYHVINRGNYRTDIFKASSDRRASLPGLNRQFQTPSMPTVTTLDFSGRTEEALNFYSDVLNAETVFLMRFRESPDQTYSQPGMGELIFHATFRIEGTKFMASDVGYAQRKTHTPFSGPPKRPI